MEEHEMEEYIGDIKREAFQAGWDACIRETTYKLDSMYWPKVIDDDDELRKAEDKYIEEE